MKTQKLPLFSLIISLVVAVFSIFLLLGGTLFNLYQIGTSMTYFIFGIQIVTFLVIAISFLKWGRAQMKGN